MPRGKHEQADQIILKRHKVVEDLPRAEEIATLRRLIDG